MHRSLILGSIILGVSALAGCGEPEERDAGTDTGGTIDTGMTDGGGVDTGGMTPDTPSSSRVCSVGAGGCDIILQNCEPEGGTARGCYLGGSDTMAATQCAPSGVLTEGAACTSGSQCAEGFGCQDGFCRAYCCMEMDSDCPIGFSCIPYRDPAGTGLLPIGVCDPPVSCEVIPNSGCPDDGVCQPGMDGTLRCRPAGTAAIGEACGDTVGCVAESGCYGTSDADLHCIAFCELATPTTCATGTTCTAQPAVVGGGYGLCTPTG